MVNQSNQDNLALGKHSICFWRDFHHLSYPA